MNDLDHPSDYSDHPMSVDQKLITTMGEIDTITEAYIRQEIGSAQYDDYRARAKVNRDFESITAGMSPHPVELVSTRAQEIARDMVVPGEGISSEVDSLAKTAAFAEWLDSIGSDEDDDYLEVYGEVRRVLADSVNEDITKAYPGMELQNGHEGILTFEQKGADGLTLRILFKVEDEKLTTSVSYVKMPLKPGERMLQVAIDPDETNGDVDGINLSRFKSDALMALQVGTHRLQQLKDVSE